MYEFFYLSIWKSYFLCNYFAKAFHHPSIGHRVLRCKGVHSRLNGLLICSHLCSHLLRTFPSASCSRHAPHILSYASAAVPRSLTPHHKWTLSEATEHRIQHDSRVQPMAMNDGRHVPAVPALGHRGRHIWNQRPVSTQRVQGPCGPHETLPQENNFLQNTTKILAFETLQLVQQ